MKTITTRAGHSFNSGDCIEITMPDRRWWKRLLHFITFRDPPMIRTVTTITSATSTVIDLGADSEGASHADQA